MSQSCLIVIKRHHRICMILEIHIKAFQQTGWAASVTPVMQTEHNTKIQGTGAVQNIHQYSVDIIESTCKIITAYKSNVGACHERKRAL